MTKRKCGIKPGKRDGRPGPATKVGPASSELVELQDELRSVLRREYEPTVPGICVHDIAIFGQSHVGYEGLIVASLPSHWKLEDAERFFKSLEVFKGQVLAKLAQ